MNIWIDTEFNEYKGELISMALCAEDGSDWYEVLPCAEPGKWVSQHVIPFLGKQQLHHIRGIAESRFSDSLRLYLSQFKAVNLIADWPDDIKHFCASLITGPGQCISTPPLSIVIDRTLPNTAEISLIPHNALEDARALRRAALSRMERA